MAWVAFTRRVDEVGGEVRSAIYQVLSGYVTAPAGFVWDDAPPHVEGRLPAGRHQHFFRRGEVLGTGVPDGLRQSPSVVLDSKVGRVPLLDGEGVSRLWLVSQRAKQVFESIDASAFEFSLTHISYRSGEPYMGSAYWLCDVVRNLDALDEVKSNATLGSHGEDQKYVRLPIEPTAVFRATALKDHHVFRLAYTPSFVGCDEMFRSAVETAGLTGFGFIERGFTDG